MVSNGDVPWRLLAPESLLERVFTMSSDVWALGKVTSALLPLTTKCVWARCKWTPPTTVLRFWYAVYKPGENRKLFVCFSTVFVLFNYELFQKTVFLGCHCLLWTLQLSTHAQGFLLSQVLHRLYRFILHEVWGQYLFSYVLKNDSSQDFWSAPETIEKQDLLFT